MTSRVVGFGTAVPSHTISQAQSAEVARRFVHDPGCETDVLPLLYRMTTVRSRGSVLLEGHSESRVQQSFYHEALAVDDAGPTTADRNGRYADEAGPLAVQAARDAIDDAGIDPAQVTHLVVATCTGFHAPGVDVDLIESLGLPPTTQRVQVGFMGCHGGINALRTARGLAAADPGSVVLVVCVELCSLHYQYGWDTDRVVANALFADGAGAMVVVGPLADSAAPVLAATGSMLIPASRDAMSWQVGNHGFVMTLSAEVPEIIQRTLPDFLNGWLHAQGLSAGDVGGWAVHPGGPRILQAVEMAMKLPSNALQTSRAVLAEHGNMSSATTLFILKRFHAVQRPRPWIALGFGPGLEVEVALLTDAG